MRVVPRMMRVLFVAFLVTASAIVALAQDRRPDSILEPLSFQPNLGQETSGVRFASTGPGYRLLITNQDATISLQKPGDAFPSNVRMTLLNGKPASEVSSSDPLSIRNNYYIGNDPRKWVTGVPGFGKVHLREVYRGVDLVYYGNEGQVEYDFIVAPGTDPRKIEMVFDGARAIQTNPNGDLELNLDGGHVALKRPLAYQERDGRRLIIPSSYAVDNNRHVRFNLGSYDPQLALVIDPSISIIDYLDGGQGFSGTGRGIAANAAGVTYVTGYFSTGVFNPNVDVFVKKFDPTGSPRWTTTTLSGSGDDKAKDIAVDSNGNVYIIGSTQSTNYPTTGSPLQTNLQTDNGSASDVFITKLSPSLTTLYSTYFGGSGIDFGDSIAVSNCAAATCEIVIAGTTGSTNLNTALGATFTNFPGTANVAGNNNGFVARLIDNGTQLSWGPTPFARSLGAVASRTMMTMDSGRRSLSVAANSTEIFVAGGVTSGTQTNANVWKVSNVPYSKLLHADSGKNSFANAIAVDAQGNAHVAGETNDLHFPINCLPADQFCQPIYNGTPGATSLDGFYAKLDVGGVIVYGTYLGSPGMGGSNVEDIASAVALTSSGDILVAGKAGDQSFPHQGTAVNFNGTNNGFVAGFSPAQVLFASTFLNPSSAGGAHQAESVTALTNGNAMVLGTSTAGATLGPWVAQVDMLATPPVGFSSFTVTMDAPQPACPADPMALPPCYYSAQSPNLNPPPQIATITVGLANGLPQTSTLTIELLDSSSNPINQITNPTYVSTTGPLTISADRKTLTFGLLYRASPPPGLAAIRLRAAIGSQKCTPGDTRCYGTVTIVGLPAISSVIFAPNFVPAGGTPIYGTPGKLVAGNTTTGKVVLNAGAVIPINVFLNSSSTSFAAVSPSTQVSGIAANPASTSDNFSITAGQVAAITPVTITASLSSGGSGTASGFGTMYILPDLKLPALPVGLTLNPNPLNGVYSGTPIVATATLANGAIVPNDPLYPAAGLTFRLLKVENGNDIVVATGFIPRGQGSGTISFVADSVTQTTIANMRARIDAGSETNLSYSMNTNLKINPIVVTGLALSASSVLGGTDVGGTVTISAPAPAGGVSVTMTLPGGLATFVPVAEGGTTATIHFIAPVVQSPTSFTVKAELNGSTQTAPLQVLALSPTTLDFSPSTVAAGGSSTATVTLSGPATAGGVTVTLSATGIASLPSITIAEGNSTGQVVLTAPSPGATTVYTISAKLNGVTVTRNLTVTVPVPPVPATLDLSPSTVAAGSSSTAVVTLSAPATAGGVTVTLSATGIASLPSIIIAAGNSTGQVVLTAPSPSATTVYTISAKLNGATVTKNLTVTVPVPTTVAFKAFNVDVATGFHWGDDRDTFRVKGEFSLGTASNGINPVTEPVTLKVGPYSVTIPAGSFKLNGDRDGDGDLDHHGCREVRRYRFKGTINGVVLDVRIRYFNNNEYELKAYGRRADLTGIVKGQAITVQLAIGNDSGTAIDKNGKTRIKDIDMKVTVDLDWRRDRDTFKVDGGFIFEDDDTLNPATQEVTLDVGPYSVTIPAGSFKLAERYSWGWGWGWGSYGYGSTREFTFKGTIDGDTFDIRIRDLGHHEWDLSAEGRKLVFGQIVDGAPVTVGLTIGTANAEADDQDPRVK